MPSPLEKCRETCERFLRNTLPSFRAIEATLPTIPQFIVTHDLQRNRKKFEEHGQPSWWQIPKDAWNEAFNTDSGRAYLNSLESTEPFQKAIGKSLWVEEKGRGVTGIDKEYMAREISTSYLFAAATGPWRPHKFKLIWSQCVDYYDPSKKEINYVLYAPIWGISGVPRSMSLGDGLMIRRLTADHRAKIASLDSTLAGVTTRHRFTLWPGHFFVKECKFRKWVGEEKKRSEMMLGQKPSYSWLNEEVVLLRALLSDEIAVPAFALIFEGYPRDGGGGYQFPSLPWRPRSSFVNRQPTGQEVARYKTKRARFKVLIGSPGWPAVMASMRRYAVAWENPYPADSLADIVAAFEGLLVRGERTEVSYKLRVRATNILSSNASDRRTILNDIRDAYDYRSRIAHGDYVFDTLSDWEMAKSMKATKGKKKKRNPFHDVNEVHRLKGRIAGYYRSALSKMISTGKLEIEWASRGL